MKPLILEDLKEMNTQKVLSHLAYGYAGTESGFSYGEIKDDDVEEAKKKLRGMKVLIAYESVGSYGCDSNSYFLLQDKEGKLFEVHGSHCSCYGFEGQLYLEETTKEALKMRNDAGGVFCTGGYDSSEEQNKLAVSEYIKKFCKPKKVKP